MPELPEVETIKRGLEKLVLNKKIVQVKIFEDKEFIGESTSILNTKIIGLRRKGKALIFDLDNKNSFLVHLFFLPHIKFIFHPVLLWVR